MVFSSFMTGCVDNSNSNLKDKFVIYVSLDGTANYTSIEDAIDAAPKNYSVFVYSGHYYEYVVINKTINVTGENSLTTIIDANGHDDVVLIKANLVNFSGFTLINSGDDNYREYDAGVDIDGDFNVIYNNIFYNNTCGVYSAHSTHNTVRNNIIKSNNEYGVLAYSGSNYLKIIDNSFFLNPTSLRVKGSNHCEIIRNRFNDSDKGMYFCCGAKYNLAYHNSFFNHKDWNGDDQVGGNDWNSLDLNQGNYWDDYEGIDADGDGIGDTAYNISNSGRLDYYPLMNPVV